MKRKVTKITTLALAICLIATFSYGCKKEENVDNVGEANYSHFEQYVDATTLGFTTVAIDPDEISAGTTVSDKKNNVLYVLGIADTNYAAEGRQYAKLSLGGGSAETAGLGGEMVVRSLKIQETDRFYYQTVGRVINGDPTVALGLAQMILDQGKREYKVYGNLDDEDETNDWINYYQEPKNKGVKDMDSEDMFPDSFPYADCDYDKVAMKSDTPTTAEPDPTFDDDDLTLELTHSITDFIINNDSILDNDNLIFSSEVIDGHTLYTISYELKLDTEAAQDMYTTRPRRGMRKASTSSDLEYVKYIASAKVWDNGLMQSYTSEESWEATLELNKFLKPHGASESLNTDYYSWHPYDVDIDNYIDDEIIDNLDWTGLED